MELGYNVDNPALNGSLVEIAKHQNAHPAYNRLIKDQLNQYIINGSKPSPIQIRQDGLRIMQDHWNTSGNFIPLK